MSSSSCCLKCCVCLLVCWSLLSSCFDRCEGSIGLPAGKLQVMYGEARGEFTVSRPDCWTTAPVKMHCTVPGGALGEAHKHHMEGAGVFPGLINNYRYLPNVVRGQWDGTVAVRWQLPQKWVAGRVMQLRQVKAKKITHVETDFLNIHTFSYCVPVSAERWSM